jgi:hypothetical protein
MNTRLLYVSILSILIVGLSTGCGSAGLADDAGRYGDDLIRLASKYGDNIAIESAQYTDEVGRTVQLSDEAIQYWDDILRSSQVVDGGARLLHRDTNLTPLQNKFVSYLRTEGNLADEESLLYLQGVCYYVGFVKDWGSPPSKSSAQKYIENVADSNDIPLSSMMDFTESVVVFSQALIDETGTQQKASEVLFNGLCLASDLYK